MGHRFQVCIDCSDPHVLAEWWAETMSWQVEPQDESFIRLMIEQGHATEAETRLYRGALVWRTGAAIHPDAPAGADRPRWLFQEVPEGKTAKNRVHMDIRIEEGTDVDAFRSSLLARGATKLHEGRQGPHTWFTMADPEGNEFCV
ncbi:MAG: VOC family protein [Ilumatobacteraceae bacterium]